MAAMDAGTSAVEWEAKLRRVRYETWGGVWSTWTPAESSLLTFVYDVPHLGAAGIFPPLHVLNEYLRHGGGGGGMGPSARWEPFTISAEEYGDLVAAIRAVPPASVVRPGCWIPPAFDFDPEFDGDPATYKIYPGYRHRPPSMRKLPAGLETYFAWKAAVCAKHRDGWDDKVRQSTIEQISSRLGALRPSATFAIAPRSGRDPKPAADSIAASVGFVALGELWIETTRPDARELLERVLQRDLAYQHEETDLKQAGEIAAMFVGLFEGTTHWLTNGTFAANGGWSGNPVASGTFETGVVVVSDTLAGILWVEDED
jgi:hypothetical protein